MSPSTVLDTIGSTPLVRLERLAPANGAELWLKLENTNAERSRNHRTSNGIASHDLPLVVPNCLAFLVMGCTIAIALDKR